MKRLVWIALMLLVAVPAFPAAKKITIAELKDMLATMHAQNKSDQQVADALKQVQLSEMLDRATMNAFAGEVPGKFSTEQIYVLEARSALLPPPAAAIPTTPALSAAAQQAVLSKAAAYASGLWSKMPDLTATKTTLRFQDNMEALADASSMHGGSTDSDPGLFVNPYNYIHYINSSDTPIGLDNGAERVPEDKTQWGRNKMIQVMDPDPDLATIFQEAKQYGDLTWERWEVVNGKPAAVFSYDVPKKKARMTVDVCCFPEIEQAGIATFTGSQFGSGATGGTASSAGGAKGNLQTNTSWSPYKEKNVGYHGEFFIDPDTGIVVRMNTIDEQKSSDMVHQLDTRIDYGPVIVGGKAFILPVRSIMITEVVPNGEAGAGGISTRTTLFTSEYKNYAAGK
ncbi:MAG: hypothetical protein WCF17_19605 [Terracidiphilus sp.]